MSGAEQVPLIRRRRRLFSQMDSWTNDFRSQKVERSLMDGLQKVVVHIDDDDRISSSNAWKRMRTAPRKMVPGGEAAPYQMIIDTLDSQTAMALDLEQQSPDERYLRFSCLIVSYYRFIAWDIGVRNNYEEIKALERWVETKLSGKQQGGTTKLFARTLRDVQACLPEYYHGRTKPTGCILRMLDVWLKEALQKDYLVQSRSLKSPTSSTSTDYPQARTALLIEAGTGEFVASVCLRWRLFHTLRWCIEIVPEILNIQHQIGAESVLFGQLIQRMTGSSFLRTLHSEDILNNSCDGSCNDDTPTYHDDHHISFYQENDLKKDLANISVAHDDKSHEPQSVPTILEGKKAITQDCTASDVQRPPLESVEFRVAVVNAVGRHLEDWWPEFIQASCNLSIPVLVRGGARAVVPGTAGDNKLKEKVREIVHHCSSFRTELHDIPYPDMYGGIQGQEMSVEEYAGKSGTGGIVGISDTNRVGEGEEDGEGEASSAAEAKGQVDAAETKEEVQQQQQLQKRKCSGDSSFKPSTYLFIRPAPMKDYWPLQMLDHLLERLSSVIYTTDRAQFAMGPHGTGAPVHFHRPAFNFTLLGAKRWFLFPPEHAAWSNVPISEMMATAENASPMEAEAEAARSICPQSWGFRGASASESSICRQVVQRAGDIFFVPTHVGHGVLNQGAVCAAVAQEICQYGTLDDAIVGKHDSAFEKDTQTTNTRREVARILSF